MPELPLQAVDTQAEQPGAPPAAGSRIQLPYQQHLLPPQVPSGVLSAALEGASLPQVLGLYVPALRRPNKSAVGTKKHALGC